MLFDVLLSRRDYLTIGDVLGCYARKGFNPNTIGLAFREFSRCNRRPAVEDSCDIAGPPRTIHTLPFISTDRVGAAEAREDRAQEQQYP